MPARTPGHAGDRDRGAPGHDPGLDVAEVAQPLLLTAAHADAVLGARLHDVVADEPAYPTLHPQFTSPAPAPGRRRPMVAGPGEGGPIDSSRRIHWPGRWVRLAAAGDPSFIEAIL